MRPSGRTSRFLLSALGFCAGILLAAVLGEYLFELLLMLLALGLIVRALEPLAKRRGWGSEGRLTRHLNRPGLIEEDKQFCVGSRHGL